MDVGDDADAPDQDLPAGDIEDEPGSTEVLKPAFRHCELECGGCAEENSHLTAKAAVGSNFPVGREIQSAARQDTGKGSRFSANSQPHGYTKQFGGQPSRNDRLAEGARGRDNAFDDDAFGAGKLHRAGAMTLDRRSAIGRA